MTAGAPIGIFDSGLGGLTIVKALQENLPEENLIYFGDTAHLPYGDKSPDIIRNYSAEISRFLLRQEVKAIVIACNTASAVALETVKNIAPKIPVFNVIDPAVAAACNATQRKQVGVIGTKTTVGSGVYKAKINGLVPDAGVIQKATPILVPLIEEGWSNNQVSQEIVDAYLSDTGFLEIDTLILGCTHYPLIKSGIEKYFAENFDHEVKVIDSSQAVAAFVKERMQSYGLLNHSDASPSHTFYVSDLNPHFQESAKLFLNQAVEFRKPEL